ncbi:MAG: site-specific DNA-methyltransferase [Clostridia bacterium]|nr:site-specific DNA-methyltransferase [Clostridia bacterium]
MQFIYELENILKKDSRFISEDGNVLKAKVYDAAMGMDKGLITLLMKNDLTKEHFFTDVEGILVFDKLKFSWVLESREFLPDSYTKYKNKIGLMDDKDNLISKNGNVALVWPYKDCVLEGGQTKEEERRDEIFYNEILAPYEVNRLLQ